MSIETKPLNGKIGLEILGLELDKPLSDADRETLYNAWLEAGVLLFRNTGATPEQQLELSRCFGELEIHPIEGLRVKGYPELIQLTNKGNYTEPLFSYDGEPTVGRIPWHIDLIYTPSLNRGALLRMVEKPAKRGETGWIDGAAAYEELSDELKARIEGLEARYEFVIDVRDMRFGLEGEVERLSDDVRQFPEFQPVAHRLVLEHPETGRKSLCISPVQLINIVGMENAEGDALLQTLVDHLLQPRFSYIHNWEVGDMIIWENWRCLHMAFGHAPDASRLVHRTTIKGDRTFGRLI